MFVGKIRWSGLRESNPSDWLGKPCYFALFLSVCARDPTGGANGGGWRIISGMEELSLRSIEELMHVANDLARSLEERREAAARWRASLDVHMGQQEAQVAGTVARLGNACEQAAVVMPELGATMDRMSAAAIAALTDQQRAWVLHAVEQGAPVLDAIVEAESLLPAGSPPPSPPHPAR